VAEQVGLRVALVQVAAVVEHLSKALAHRPTQEPTEVTVLHHPLQALPLLVLGAVAVEAKAELRDRADQEAAGQVVRVVLAQQARQILVAAVAVVTALEGLVALALSSFATLTLLLRHHQQQALQQSPCLVGIAFTSGPLQVLLLSEVTHGKEK
jgi:hypothetical protein